MANVPIEFRWTDDEERAEALAAISDVEGKVSRELDGIIAAEVPEETISVLRERKEQGRLTYNFPRGITREGESLAAAVPVVDPFPTRVDTSSMVEETKDVLQEFANRTLQIGIKKTKDAFFVRREPRKTRNPEIDGPARSGVAKEAIDATFEEILGDSSLSAELATLPEDVYLVHLNGPIEPQWREQLRKIGPLGDHCPPTSFRMYLSPQQLEEVQALPFVNATKRYGLLDTLTPSMVKLLTADADPTTLQQFEVAVHMPGSIKKVVDLLEKTAGVDVLDQGPMSLRFETTANSPIVSAIAQLPLVRTIAPYVPPKLFLDQARPLIGVEVVSPRTAVLPNGPWDGSGEVAAIFDSGVDPTHPDIAPALDGAPARFKTGAAIDTNGHGTHVAGIIAGRGVASSGFVRGVAPGSKIRSIGMVDASGDLLIPVELGDLLQLATAAGAKVINLSWGKKIRFDYDIYGESIDRFLRQNPEVLIVVAAGNEGVAERTPGPRLGFHMPRTIGMPAAAKNVITVGACCNDRMGFIETWGQLLGSLFAAPPASNELVVSNTTFPAAISSRGPTGFDAVKPEILAPGTMVLSARAATTTVDFVNHALPAPLNGLSPYAYLNGTSMAAPMVTGAALLLRQFLRVERNLSAPSAALLKALLILATRRIANANAHSILRDDLAAVPPRAVGYPDFDQGFGVIDLRAVFAHGAAPPDRKLAFHDVANADDMALEARVAPDSHRRAFRPYKLEVPADSATPLRVALVWTDVSGRGIQNLLSLEVKCPDGTVVPGNHDRRMFVDEFAIAVGATPFDKLNTAQLVVIPDPAAGSYRVTVRAEATTSPPQGYALVACGPLKDDKLKPLF